MNYFLIYTNFFLALTNSKKHNVLTSTEIVSLIEKHTSLTSTFYNKVFNNIDVTIILIIETTDIILINTFNHFPSIKTNLSKFGIFILSPSLSSIFTTISSLSLFFELSLIPCSLCNCSQSILHTHFVQQNKTKSSFQML